MIDSAAPRITNAEQSRERNRYGMMGASVQIFSRYAVIMLSVILIGSIVSAVGCRPAAEHRLWTPSEQRPTTIAASGEILGIRIGANLEEARAKLSASHVSFAERRGKDGGEEGEQIYWKLEATEYNWVMIWTDREHRVAQLSASVRPENPKPFEEIGDLAKASNDQSDIAVWDVVSGDRLHYRVVAKGTNRRARTVYMTAIRLP